MSSPWSDRSGHESVIVESRGAGAADFGDHRVEREALLARDAAVVGVVGPRGEQEQPAFRAGLEVVPRRFELRCKAVLAEGDEREFRIKRGAGNGLFAGADAGRDKHRASLGGIEQTFGFGSERVGRDASRALNLQVVGAIEQKGVPVGGVDAPCERKLVDAREVAGVLSNEREAARVVGDIAKERLQLAAMGEYAVVVAGGEQVRRIRHIWRITERRITRQHLAEPISLGAPDLKAANNLAQMAAHARANEEQPVKMVGHDNAGEKLNLGVVAGNLAPTGLDAFAERRLRNARADELAENRTSPLDFKRDHVDATLVVVVAKATPFHFGGKRVRFACHACIIPNGRKMLKAA